MKKIITLVLSLLLCCSIFTACDFVSDSGYVDGSSSVTESSTAADAIAVVNSLYRTSFRENNKTSSNFEVVSQVMVGTDVYPVTWTIEGTDLITLSEVNNYMYTVIIPEVIDGAIEYTLTASVTDGTTTETTSYALVATRDLLTIAQALAAEDGTTVLVRGIVNNIGTAWDDGYKNISVTIGDGTNSLYIYRLKTKVEEGDIITVNGEMATYNGNRQIAAGATATIDGKHTDHEYENGFCKTCGASKPAAATITIAEALAEADGAQVKVQGIVNNIGTAWSDSFNNISVTIGDGTNSLYIYRLATKVEEGDIITVTGYMTSYNGNRQIAAGATATIDGKHTDHDYENGFCKECGASKPAAATITIAEALATADDAQVKVAGVVSKINYEWSDQYNNMSVTITDGTDTLYVYRLATKVELYDEITVTGYMTTYTNSDTGVSTKQVNAGATATIDGKHSHTYENGTCTVCGAAEPVTPDPVTTCPGCGSTTEVHEECSVCGEYLCKGDHTDCTTTPDPEVLTIADALAKTDGTTVVVKGIVISIDTAWSTQYNNISVTIADGTHSLYVFRLATNVELYDIITVTGSITTYSSARQIEAGATATIDGKHTHTLGDVQKDESNHWYVCSTCGAVVDKEAHDFSNGNCECGQEASSVSYATAELSFADTAKRTTFTTSQQVWADNGITLTNDKASSTSNVANYSKPARFYKSSSLSIAFTSAMTKIEFTCNTANYAEALAGSIAASDDYTVTFSGKVVTVTFTTATTELKIDSLDAQVRMDSLTVTYAA